MEPIKVAILGGSGYTALELMKIALRHPGLALEAVISRQEGNPQVADTHPILYKRLNLRFENLDPKSLRQRGVQCVFGCLPHGTSQQTIPNLLEHGLKVIDLSADYRLRDPQLYQQWYGEVHHDRHNLARAVYGLPEIYGKQIDSATLIANPGCYPQTAILGLAPLVAEGYIETTGIIVDSKSGVSGAGRTPKLTTHFPECNESLAAYSVGSHRHTPEIEQALTDISREKIEVIFTPHLIPMDRGIFSTIYATPRRPIADLNQLYRDYYAGAPFVRVRETLPTTKDTMHTNYLDLYVKSVRNKIVILACEDNLVRGASGVAIQNFNRLFGFPETTGLL